MIPKPAAASGRWSSERIWQAWPWPGSLGPRQDGQRPQAEPSALPIWHGLHVGLIAYRSIGNRGDMQGQAKRRGLSTAAPEPVGGP